MHMDPFTHDAYREAYSEDEDFKEVYEQLQIQSHVLNGDNTVDYHLQMGYSIGWISYVFRKVSDCN